MITIPHTCDALHYAGRWRDDGDGMSSGWQGSQIRFKVSGSVTLRVNAIVQDNNSTDLTSAVVNTDGGAPTLKYFTTQPVVGSGLKSIEFALPDTGEHTIVLKLPCMSIAQFSGESFCRLSSIQLDDGATLSAWGGSAPVRIQAVGDSWMSSVNDWPHLLGADDYYVYPLAFGGAKASDLNAKYLFDRVGLENVAGIDPDIIIIGAGVNDYAAGVSAASFESSIGSLVDKARARHPGSVIVLLGCPRNVSAAKYYDQYFSCMQAVAAARTGVMAIPIPSSVWPSLEWSSDTYHLTYAGLHAFSAYVKTQLPKIAHVDVGGAYVRMFSDPAADPESAPCSVIDGTLYTSISTCSGPLFCRVGSDVLSFGGDIID
jgi:hypothetical protein